MANIKSQIKRIRTNEKARLRNKAARAEVKTRIKSAVAVAEAGGEEAQEILRMAVKRLDKAASRGIIHRNQAANRKSALMRRVHAHALHPAAAGPRGSTGASITVVPAQAGETEPALLQETEGAATTKTATRARRTRPATSGSAE